MHVKIKLLFYHSYSKNASVVRWHFWCPEMWINMFFGSWSPSYSQERCEGEICWPSILHYKGSSVAKPQKTSSECCRACRKSLLCAIWCWLESEVLARLCEWCCVQWVNYATCGASETCGTLSVQIYIHMYKEAKATCTSCCVLWNLPEGR